MTNKEKLLQFMKEHALSATRLGRLTDRHEKTVRDYVKGRKPIPDKFIEAMYEAKTVEGRHDLELQKILSVAQKKKVSVGELSRILDRSKETIVKAIEELHKQGHDIELDKTSSLIELRRDVKRDFEPLQLDGLFKNQLKFGLCSDKHYGSNYQQPTLVNAAYRVMEEEGCAFVVDSGDLSDGHPRMHRGFGQVQWFNGDADELRDYVVDIHPKPKSGMKTYILDSGSHDYIWKKIGGFNFVRSVCEKRPDLVQRDGDEAIFGANEQIHIMARHPMGGVSYAKSYHPQKHNTAMLQWAMRQLLADTAKPVWKVFPHVVACGHYHCMFYLPEGGTNYFLVGCFQSQTPYLRDKGLYPDVGFWIVTLFFDDDGRINRTQLDPFNWSHLVKERDY